MPESQTAAEERGLIEQLMDEESEVADDPTQNALLSSAQTARTAPTPVDYDEQEEDPPQHKLPDEELADAGIPPQTLQNDPGSDLAPQDESNYIQLPEGLAGDPGAPGEDMVEMVTMDPVQMPVGQRADPSWDEALAEMMEQANQTFQGLDMEPHEQNSWESEMNWQTALSERGNTE